MLEWFKKFWNGIKGLDEDGFPLNGDCPCCVDEPECVCCTNAIDDGDECTCKEDQVFELNGVVHRWRSRTVCDDYNCSYCH